LLGGRVYGLFGHWIFGGVEMAAEDGGVVVGLDFVGYVLFIQLLFILSVVARLFRRWLSKLAACLATGPCSPSQHPPNRSCLHLVTCPRPLHFPPSTSLVRLPEPFEYSTIVYYHTHNDCEHV